MCLSSGTASKTARRTFLHVCHLCLILGVWGFCCCGCLFPLLARFFCFCREKHLNLRLQGLHDRLVKFLFSGLYLISLPWPLCLALHLLCSPLSCPLLMECQTSLSSPPLSGRPLLCLQFSDRATRSVTSLLSKRRAEERSTTCYHLHRSSLFYL